MTRQTIAPRVSVAIATLNEGPDLEATIALVYASKYRVHEVIVADDNSKSDPTARLSAWRSRSDFRFIRHTERKGSGATKESAISAATGDLVVVLDSHMRPHWEWLNQIVQAHLTHPNAILCTESIGFRPYGTSSFYGRGAWFDPANPYKHGAHTVSWKPSEKLEPGPYPRIAAMHGGCYIFPRYQLQRIRGYAPGLKGWGYEEEWVAIRSAAMGIETRLISGCAVQHQYERNLSRVPEAKEKRPQYWEAIYNRHAVAIAAFGEQRWETVYRKRIEEASEKKTHRHVREEIEEARGRLAEMHEWIRSEGLPERLWMDRLGIVHPANGEPAPGDPAPSAGSEDPQTGLGLRIDPRGLGGPTVVG